MKKILLAFPLLVIVATSTVAQSLDAMIDREIAQLVSTYKMLHASPELSHYEVKTSAFLADQLRSFGYTVTERIGKCGRPQFTGYGIVAVMKNGDGPTVLVRADIDALPVEEKNNVPYASKVKTKNDLGQEVSVMHACGHDVHITNLIGTAKILAALKDQWRGTLVLIGQPAEETVDGAKAMLADGLYTRFSKPDFAVGLHDSADAEAGKILYVPGYAMASSTSVDLIIRGLGGHGSKPEATKDPIVIASQTILALQTIISRENSPLDPAVVTIGSIHGGTKRNIIPDEVVLQLTIRTYKEEVRQHILASIERIAKGVAMAAGVPEDRAPIVKVIESANGPSLYNDPAVTERLANAIGRAIGPENVIKSAPLMASEDFGVLNLDHKIPSFYFWLGALVPEKIEGSKKAVQAMSLMDF